MQGLSVRRHHEQRLKAIWQKRLKAFSPDCFVGKTEKQIKRIVGRKIHTPAQCSCHMCGNARKYFHQRSFKESLHFLELCEGVSEL
jgi:hypothetical protein